MIKYDYCNEQFDEAKRALRRRGKGGPSKERIETALMLIGVLTDGRSSIPPNVEHRFNALMQLRGRTWTQGEMLDVEREIKELADLVETAYKESVSESRKESRKQR